MNKKQKAQLNKKLQNIALTLFVLSLIIGGGFVIADEIYDQQQLARMKIAPVPSNLPINNITQISCPTIAGVTYDYCVNRGSYEAYFRDTHADTKTRPAAIKTGNYTITYAPQDVIDFDPANPGNAGIIGNRISSTMNNSTSGVITYKDNYARTGTNFADLEFLYKPDRLTHNLILTNQQLIRDRWATTADTRPNTSVTYDTVIRAFRGTSDLDSDSLGILYGTDRKNFKNFGVYSNNDLNTTDTIYFVDSNNETVFYIPSLIAKDSAGATIQVEVQMQMTSAGNLKIIKKIPFQWLNDSSRVYPVRVDPETIVGEGYIIYQDINSVIFDADGTNITASLVGDIDDDGIYEDAVDDNITVSFNEGTWKYGAINGNMNSTDIKKHKYDIYSTLNLKQLEDGYYYFMTTATGGYKLNVEDICSDTYSNCSFSFYTDSIGNHYVIEFWSSKNIDPSFTYNNFPESNLLLRQIRFEGSNYTHLEINDTGERYLGQDNNWYVTMGDLPLTSGRDTATFVVWVRIGNGLQGITQSFFSKAYTTSGEWDLFADASRIKFNAWNSTTNVTVQTISTITHSTWYQIVGVKNQTHIQLYLNGVYQAGASLEGTLNDTNDRMCLSYRCSSAAIATQSYALEDEAMIFDRALTAAEISTLYNNGRNYTSPITTNGLVGYWTFDDYLNNAEDYSTLGNSGAFMGGMTTYIDTTFANNNLYQYLLGYWAFDADVGGTAYDTYRNPSMDGTYQAQAAPTNNGYIGKGAEFNALSTSYININTPDRAATKRPYTISAWIYPKGNAGAGSLGGIITMFDGTNNPALEMTTNASETGVLCASDMANAASLTTGEYVPISLNEWTHITCVLDTTSGANFTIYKNGAYFNNTYDSDAGNFVYTWTTTYIGSEKTASVRTFNGTIDELMIIDKALTSAQILAIYNNQSVRFKSTGTQTYVQTHNNTNSSHNLLNFSISNLSTNGGSFISARVGLWNYSKGYNTTTSFGTIGYGLIAHWTADGDANDLLGLNNGTFIGDANASGIGVYNNSFEFDGTNDGIYVNYSASLGSIMGPNTPRAWAFWIKTTDSGNHIISEIGTNKHLGSQMLANKVTCSNGGTAKSSAVVTDGQWHHIVCNYNGINIYVYTDGALGENGAQTGSAASTENLSIGIRLGLTGDLINTSLDEFMIWNRSLSASEIKQLYVGGRANWEYSAWQNLTGPNQNVTFNVGSGTTNYLPEIELFSDANSFYTPYINGTLRLESYYLSPDSSPVTTLTAPTDASSYYTAAHTFNATHTDDINLTSSTFYLWNSTNSLINTSLFTITGTSNSSSYGYTLPYYDTFKWNYYACDSASQCAFATANFTITYAADITKPNVTWNSQVPADLNSSNAISTGMNITYNATDDGILNTSTVLLYYKVNSSLLNNEIIRYINGTGVSGYVSHAYEDNVSSTFRFHLEDHDIYPGTYNLDPLYLEAQTFLSYSLENANTYIKTRVYNTTNLTQFNFLEVGVINRTAAASDLRIYYCNSSYTTGPLAASSFCTQFATIPATQTPAHCHDGGECDYVVPVAIVSGSIGSVKVTDASFFALRGTTSPTNNWNVSYVSDITRPDQVRISTNGGTSWTNFTGTNVLHFHQFTNQSSLWYYACANDTYNNQNCTTPREDIFNLGGLPPIAPNIYYPTAGNYSGNLTINWTASQSPNGYAISYYNITLRYPNETYVLTINDSNTGLSQIWDSSGLVVEGQSYQVHVTAYDSLNQTETGESEEIAFDNTYPTVVLNTPANASTITTGANINFTANVTDNLGATSVTLYIYNSLNQLVNQTTTALQNILTGTIGTVVTLVDGIYTWFYSVTDSAGNIDLPDDGNYTITVDNNGPVITVYSPTDASTSRNRSILINFTATNPGDSVGSLWFYNGTGNTTYTEPTYITYSTMGSKTIYLYANDTTQGRTSSAARTVNIDLIDVNSVGAIPSSPLTDQNVTISVNVSSWDGDITCNLTGTLGNYGNTTAQDLGVNLTFATGTHTAGVYTYTVNCSNPYGSQSTSSSVTVRNYPDLYPSAIAFSNSNPALSEEITISATIESDYQSTENVTVDFYDGATFIGQSNITLIGQDSNSIAQIAHTFTSEGVHSIKAEVDRYNNITEYSETNNNFTKAIIVGSGASGTINVSFTMTPNPIEQNTQLQISGNATYGFAPYENVAGAIVYLTIPTDGVIAETVYNTTTNSQGQFTFSPIIISHLIDTYAIVVNVSDGSASGSNSQNLQVIANDDPGVDFFIGYTTYTTPSLPLVSNYFNITVPVYNLAGTASNVTIYLLSGSTVIDSYNLTNLNSSTPQNARFQRNVTSEGLVSYILYADYYNEVAENNETNNNRNYGTWVWGTGTDLNWIGFYMDDYTPVVNVSHPVYITLQNYEATAAGNTNVNVYMNDVLINSSTVSSTQTYGGGKLLTYYVNFTQVGSNTIKFCANCDRAVTESDYSNNNYSYTATAQATALPEFVVSDNIISPLGYSARSVYYLYADNPTNLSVSITNSGDANETGDISVEGYILNTVVSASDLSVIDQNITGLNKSQTRTSSIQSFTLNKSYLFANNVYSQTGQTQIKGRVNNKTAISEIYATNNLRNETYHTIMPDLEITAANVAFNKTNPELGEVIEVQALVENLDTYGDAYNVVVQLNESGTYIGEDIINITKGSTEAAIILYNSSVVGEKALTITVNPQYMTKEVDLTASTASSEDDLVNDENNIATKALIVGDDSAPIINFTGATPTNASTINNREWILAFSINESVGITLSTLKAYVTNSTGSSQIFTNFTCTGAVPSYSCTGTVNATSDGVYTYNVTINDSSNNQGWSETRTVTLILDPDAPVVQIHNPLDMQTFIVDSPIILLNATVTDGGTISSAWWSVTNGLVNNTFAVINGTASTTYMSIAQTIGTTVSYPLSVCAQDDAGNIGCDVLTFTIRVMESTGGGGGGGGSTNVTNRTVTDIQETEESFFMREIFAFFNSLADKINPNNRILGLMTIWLLIIALIFSKVIADSFGKIKLRKEWR